MAALDDALAEIAKSVNGHVPANSNDSATRAELIVKARVHVSNQYRTLLDAMKDDARFETNPELKQEFAKRLQEIRHQLARHQVKWPLKAMEEDNETYQAETHAVSAGNRTFITWAEKVLKSA